MTEIKREVLPGQIYKHFKNKYYQIITVAKHSETGEKLVIYQQLYGKFEVYARPYDMFTSLADREKYPDVTQKYRFELTDRNSLVLCSEEKKDMLKKSNCIEENSEIELKAEQNKTIDQVESHEIDSEEDLESVNQNLLKFLDCDTYEEKRNILMRMKDELDDKLIDDIAASMDVIVEKGDIDMRYISLLNCIDMMAKFEVNRFR